MGPVIPGSKSERDYQRCARAILLANSIAGAIRATPGGPGPRKRTDFEDQVARGSRVLHRSRTHMHYREFQFGPPLSDIVECLWLLEDNAGQQSTAPERLLPDGCVELI